MNRKTMTILVSVIVVLLALSAWYDLSRRDDTSTTAEPTATASVKPTGTAGPTTSPTAEPTKSAEPSGNGGKALDGDIVPGAFGPVAAGTDVQDAVEAGYLERDPQREGACEGDHWKWTGARSSGLDVIVDNNGKIAGLGMSKPELKTAEGIGIGSTYAELQEAYGDRLQGPVRMDYGSAGSFLQDGTKWLGFGMDNKPGELDETSKIAFIEATVDARPGLIRDGC